MNVQALLLLLLDEDVHLVLADALRKRGYDAIHVVEQRRSGYPDEDQLEFAVSQKRCFVTFNVGDFVQLHNNWLARSHEHWGIVVSKQLPVGESLRCLLAMLQKENTETMRNQLRFM
jgi:hypothetical protein